MNCFAFFIILAVLCSCVAFTDVEQLRWCFDVLGASPTDSATTIKSKYRKLALLYHPDRANAHIDENIPLLTMQEINQAYECVVQSYSKEETDAILEEGWPQALSERATYLIEQVVNLWESLPETQRSDFIAEVKEYFGSGELPGDVFFLVGKYWSRSDIEAFQVLIRGFFVLFTVGCVFWAIGVVATTYLIFKSLLWMVRRVWAIFSYLLSFRKIKSE